MLRLPQQKEPKVESAPATDPFPPAPGIPTDNLDGSTVDMYPVLAQGTLIAFAWRPNVDTAWDLFSAEPASYRLH